MSLDYDKSKNKEDGNSWASYSDLFMVLSFVFLLMYVVSTMKESTHAIYEKQQLKKVTRQNEDLQQQIKVYDSLKKQYLNEQASSDEQKTYNALMSKLDLLADNTVEERNKLYKEIEKNKNKEKALNQYQQIIRNIINANLLAKSKVKRRDKIIEDKQNVISRNAKLVEITQNKVKKKLQEIQNLRKTNQITKKEYQEKVAQIKAEKESQLTKLAKEKKQALENLSREKERAIASVKEQKKQAIEKLSKESQEKELQLKGKIGSLSETVTKVSQEKEQIASNLNQIAAQKEVLEAKSKNLAKNVNELSSELTELEKENLELNEQTENAKQANRSLASELSEAKKLLEAKGKILETIKKNLEGSGVSAIINQETNEVILNFGKEYFDTGRYSLKPKMMEVLNKFIPLYSKGIFADEKAAKSIANVEIIGFASPTYKGKYIDPKSLNAADRSAVSYNLDLSYYRARSIFKYIFNTDNLVFKDQKRLLGLVKVSGRSFLSEDIKGRNIASGISQKAYCKKYDCKKSQKVIIKFNLE